MHQHRNEGASYRRVEVITGRRRRRFWSDEEKARIVAESADPEANVTEVARRNDVSRGLLSVWRREARLSPVGAAAFARVQIEDASDSRMASVNGAGAPASLDSRIEIRIGNATVYVPAGADAETLRNVLAALRFGR
jgi:transposase